MNMLMTTMILDVRDEDYHHHNRNDNINNKDNSKNNGYENNR